MRDCMQVKDMYLSVHEAQQHGGFLRVPNYPALLRFVPALRNVGPPSFKAAPRVLSPAQKADGYTLRSVFRMPNMVMIPSLSRRQMVVLIAVKCCISDCY